MQGKMMRFMLFCVVMTLSVFILGNCMPQTSQAHQTEGVVPVTGNLSQDSLVIEAGGSVNAGGTLIISDEVYAVASQGS